MAEEQQPEICVIGGGPGGIALAAAAANFGLPVVLVEKDGLGGTNLREGGVPSRALIAAAALHESLRRGPAIGVTGAPLQVNFAKVQEHVRGVVEAAARNVSAERLDALGVRVIRAEGRFADRRTVIAGETTIRARTFVIATGSTPTAPAYDGLDTVDTLSIGEALDVSRKPAHLIILGASPRGLELAQAYNRLGIDASVIDSEAALVGEDPELVAPLLERLRAEGVRVRDRVAISGIARRKGGVRVTVKENGEEIAVDGSHLLVVPGRVANVDGLGLDAAGIDFSPAGIVVDRNLRTTNKRVYAIGDAVAGPASAGRAEHHAALVLRTVTGRRTSGNAESGVPFVVFTDPEIARVGLGEEAARATDRAVRILRVPFAENDVAQAERTTAGLIKVIASDRGRILGAGVVGRGAGEIIAFWSLAMSSGLGIEALKSFPAPYPSRADISRRVAIAFDGPGRTPIRRSGAFSFFRRSG
ncbi:MAG TPA: NAD(P)/FAD-dependent oxidoreductase [Bauldia sp.]|nr:NAD(P)/FAD-dependent oxidoreductase [Bauldia sp.]